MSVIINNMPKHMYKTRIIPKPGTVLAKTFDYFMERRGVPVEVVSVRKVCFTGVQEDGRFGAHKHTLTSLCDIYGFEFRRSGKLYTLVGRHIGKEYVQYVENEERFGRLYYD